MIVDVHTHVFPPRFIESRSALAAADPGFAELYSNPRTRMATAEDLLASMEEAHVDVSVAAGFWWQSREHAEEHADYLLQAAAASDGRIVPFVPLDGCAEDARDALGRLAGAGARGVGEVRAPGEGSAARVASELAPYAEALGLALLVHATEPAGHEYGGKHGGLTPGELWALASSHPGLRIAAAHWGGGFPFYALMPEVRALLAHGRLVFDTAASPLLYEARVFRAAIDLVGVDAVLWGSDFPLRSQAADRAAVEAALPDEAERAAVLGGNAARFLAL